MFRPLWTLALAFSGVAHAAPNGIIPLQGELANDAGEPIDESIQVTFTLYADSSRTTTLWTEARTVEFDNGAFTALLGDKKSLDLEMFRDNAKVWLGVKVGTGQEMDLVPLGSAPYAAWAAHAGDATTIQGLTPEDFHRSDWKPTWADLQDVPAYVADGDADTTYRAGAGIKLTGDSFSVDETWLGIEVTDACYDTPSELRAALDSVYLKASYTPDWDDLTGIPADFADEIDDDTTYSAGTGLKLAGTSFSVDKAWAESTAKAVCYDSSSELRADLDSVYLSSGYIPDWDDLTGVPADFADEIDDDTTYSAGSGLLLSGTTFSADTTALRTTFDSVYRLQTSKVAWTDLSGVPSDLADGDDGLLESDLADAIADLGAFDLPAGTTIDGKVISAPSVKSPVIQFGSATAVPIQDYYGGMIDWPVKFSKAPVWKVGIDETIDNNGASWCHGRREAINRAWFRCNTTADALYWLAIEPGVHTIDGKMVQAGTVSSVNNLDSVFFSKTFTKAPVVILMGGWASVHERLHGTSGATTGGFQVSGVHSNGQPLHWIAMEPGSYSYNGWHWEAQIVADPDAYTDTFTFSSTFTSFPNMVFTLHDTNNSGAVYTRLYDISAKDFKVYVNDNSTEYLHYIAFERE